jgi:hypothetical protein
MAHDTTRYRTHDARHARYRIANERQKKKRVHYYCWPFSGTRSMSCVRNDPWFISAPIQSCLSAHRTRHTPHTPHTPHTAHARRTHRV